MRIIKGMFLLLASMNFSSFAQEGSNDTTNLTPAMPRRDQSSKRLSNDKTKIWKNDDYGIELSLPFYWKAIAPNEGEVVCFASPKAEIFAIKAYKGLFLGTTDAIRQRLETAFQVQLPKMTIVSSKVITLPTCAMADIIFSGTSGASSGFYHAVSFHNKKKTFIMTCLYSPAQAKQYAATINAI